MPGGGKTRLRWSLRERTRQAPGRGRGHHGHCGARAARGGIWREAEATGGSPESEVNVVKDVPHYEWFLSSHYAEVLGSSESEVNVGTDVPQYEAASRA